VNSFRAIKPLSTISYRRNNDQTPRTNVHAKFRIPES